MIKGAQPHTKEEIYTLLNIIKQQSLDNYTPDDDRMVIETYRVKFYDLTTTKHFKLLTVLVFSVFYNTIASVG